MTTEAFVASIRSGPMNDDELRASLRTGWDENLPAIKDEHGVVLVGNRRMRIAAAEGIEPVVKVVAFGTDDDARRRLAVVSNVGSVGLTPADRKRMAEQLYQADGLTQAAIAKTLGVSQATVSGDLAGLSTVDNPPPPNVHGHPRGGRPRGSGTGQRAAPARQPTTRAPAAPEPTPEPPEPAPAPTRRATPSTTGGRGSPVLDRARQIVRPLIEAGAPTPARPLGERHGISHVHIETAIAAERARWDAIQHEIPTIDPGSLSHSAQARLDAAMRQQERRQSQEFERRVQTEVNSRLSAVLPALKLREAEARRIQTSRRGVMRQADYDLILTVVHPDSRLSASAEKLAKAFRLWVDIKRQVLDETQAPTPPLDMPNTVEELLARRARVQEARRAARRPRA